MPHRKPLTVNIVIGNLYQKKIVRDFCCFLWSMEHGAYVLCMFIGMILIQF